MMLMRQRRDKRIKGIGVVQNSIKETSTKTPSSINETSKLTKQNRKGSNGASQ